MVLTFKTLTYLTNGFGLQNPPDLTHDINLKHDFTHGFNLKNTNN